MPQAPRSRASAPPCPHPGPRSHGDDLNGITSATPIVRFPWRRKRQADKAARQLRRRPPDPDTLHLAPAEQKTHRNSVLLRDPRYRRPLALLHDRKLLSSDQRRRVSASYTLVICPDRDGHSSHRDQSVTRSSHPQHLPKLRKAALRGGIQWNGIRVIRDKGATLSI